MQIGDRVKIVHDNYQHNIGRHGVISGINPPTSPQFPYEIKFDPRFQSGRCYRGHEIQVI